MNLSRKQTVAICLIAIFIACVLLTAFIQARAQSGARGVVTDESGSPIIEADLTIHNPHGTLIQKSSTDNQGRFLFGGLPPGSYVLTISASQFEPRRMILEVSRYDAAPITIKLSPAPVRSEITITDDNSRAPLYTKTAGFASLNLRGGVAIAENVSLNLALMNILDHNYRIHGSGIDAPGVNMFVGLKFSF